MLETCQKLGLAPLSLAEFNEEERRIIDAWHRRRSGKSDVYVSPALDWKCLT